MLPDILTVLGIPPIVIDTEYRDMGISQGWLILNRVYQYADDIVIEYKHIGHPP